MPGNNYRCPPHASAPLPAGSYLNAKHACQQALPECIRLETGLLLTLQNLVLYEIGFNKRI